MKFVESDLPALFENVDEIYAARGKKIVHFDLKAGIPNSKEMAEILLGRTGNLRAPTVRTGKTLIVGYNDDIYAEILAK